MVVRTSGERTGAFLNIRTGAIKYGMEIEPCLGKCFRWRMRSDEAAYPFTSTELKLIITRPPEIRLPKLTSGWKRDIKRI